MDAQQAVDNIQKVKLYHYNYKSDYAEVAGLDDGNCSEVGFIAQEVKEIFPDAVKETVWLINDCFVGIPAAHNLFEQHTHFFQLLVRVSCFLYIHQLSDECRESRGD